MARKRERERARWTPGELFQGIRILVVTPFPAATDPEIPMPLFADNVRALYASVVIAAAFIAALVLGKDLLIPLAIAACLTFILSPIVARISALRVPHGLAVSGVVLAFVVLIGALSGVIGTQLVSLTGGLSTYQANLVQKVRTLAGAARDDSAFKRASDALGTLEKNITAELAGDTPAAPAAPSSASAPERTVHVEVKNGSDGGGAGVLERLAKPLGLAGLTLLFTLFMLLQATDLRDRLVRIAGTDNLSGTTAALGDAADRLAQLFLAQALVNSAFGIAVGLALWLIGVPNALLWGVLAFLMRFVPYIGSIIAAVPPILLAAAVDPGWSMALMTLAVYVIGEPIMGHVIEPLVLGPKAGLSPFAMLASASFWALIWGPIGLILAAPLTLTLVVLGRYIKGLEFLTVLLGDEPALTAEQKLYHRLLANDALAASQQVETAAATQPMADLADEVILPALELAAEDYDNGRIERDRARFVRTNLDEISALMDLPGIKAGAGDQGGDAGDPAGRVLVVPARSLIDVAAAEFASRLISGQTPYQVALAGDETGLTALAMAASREREPVDAVVIVTAGGHGPQYLPLIGRRAETLFPSARIFLFDGSDTIAKAETSGAGSRDRGVRMGRIAALLDQFKVRGAKAATKTESASLSRAEPQMA